MKHLNNIQKKQAAEERPDEFHSLNLSWSLVWCHYSFCQKTSICFVLFCQNCRACVCWDSTVLVNVPFFPFHPWKLFIYLYIEKSTEHIEIHLFWQMLVLGQWPKLSVISWIVTHDLWFILCCWTNKIINLALWPTIISLMWLLNLIPLGGQWGRRRRALNFVWRRALAYLVSLAVL